MKMRGRPEWLFWNARLHVGPPACPWTLCGLYCDGVIPITDLNENDELCADCVNTMSVMNAMVASWRITRGERVRAVEDVDTNGLT